MSAGGSREKAVILLSGGLDSATVLACAKRDGFSCYALSFDYGQKNRFEFSAARRIAEVNGVVEQRTLTIDLRAFGGSSLTSDSAVEKGRSFDQIGQGIPLTYVPARNTIFLSYALAWAEVLGAFDIFIGVNALDWSGYPDCRPEFIASFEQTANLATRAGAEGGRRIKVNTPLISMSKSEIVRLGAGLGVDYGLTISCYDPGPGGRPCGGCDSCKLRRRGFEEAGLSDPALG